MELLRYSPDTPTLGSDDKLGIEIVTGIFGFERILGKDLGARVADAINLMGGAGDDADAAYQKALDGIARAAPDVVAALVEEYHRQPAEHYLDRWALVHLMAELQSATALDFLDRRLSDALPEEKSADPHAFSTLGEEIMILTTAVEAVTRIAATGDGRALDILLRHSSHPNFSVRRAAVQGFLAQGGADARDILAKHLPERDRALLDIRRVDVREVPQATGGLFLACRGERDLPAHDLGRDRPAGPSAAGGSAPCGCKH